MKPNVKNYDARYADFWNNVQRSENDFRFGLVSILNEFGLNNDAALRATNCLWHSMSMWGYHTPIHVMACLSWANSNEIVLENWQQLAIWFHDAIYDIGAKDNEERSAMFMRALMPKEVNTDLACEAIISTAGFMSEGISPQMQLVMDIDVCSFAWPWEHFKAAQMALSEEFLPVYGQEKTEEGRRKFLTEFVGKGFIFRTPLLKERYENKAVENIKRLLAEKTVLR